MKNLNAIWSGLDPRRKVIVLLATVGVFLAVFFLSRTAATPGMDLLYAGLQPAAAGEVVTALDQRGVAYDVRGGSIYVDTAQRDKLRLSLASEGLPANSGAGYELLDSLSGFGTTSQMFDAAYWRAKEGELARTVLASPQFKSARVHISNPTAQGFGRAPELTASVFVTPASGGIVPAQAKALRYLVASAVTGLRPEDVAIIDAATGAVISGDDAGNGPMENAELAGRLRQSVERLLAARVGPGKAVVEVSVETETDRESIVERRFDPEGRVAISSDTEERSGSSTSPSSGTVTVASNLPDGEAAGGGGESSSQDSQTRERINFEVSETKREVVRGPGAIRRLTVAVLVDGTRSVDANGTEVWTARSEEELGAMRDLVASTVGYDEARGDIITIRSLAFEPVAELGTAAEIGTLDKLGLDLTNLISLLVLGFVALGLGLFVVRPVLLSKSSTSSASLALLPNDPNLEERDSEAATELPALTAEIDDLSDGMPQMSVVSDIDFDDDMPGTLPALGAPSPDPVARLRQMIDDKQDETVEVLRSWVEDDEVKV